MNTLKSKPCSAEPRPSLAWAQANPDHPSQDCLKGLVRNLDHYTGFYGHELDHERIANSIGILPRDMDASTAALRRRQIEDGDIDLLCIHIAEGLPTDLNPLRNSTCSKPTACSPRTPRSFTP
jgi:hypothetical protein